MRTSVIIANYNYGRFLRAAIDSLLNQTKAPAEIIVVDDGSTDNSREVIKSYGGKITALFQANSGQAAAFSHGFAHATGDIVCLLDADDIFFPRKIETIEASYEQYPDAGWIFHDLLHFQPGQLPVTGGNEPAKSETIDKRAKMAAGTLTYDPPATSGLTFWRAFIAPLFPLPAAESIYISDHYIKFFALAQGPGLHIYAPLAGQLVHGDNLYTGVRNLATRARIFVNTAYFLAKAAPQVLPFCDRLMVTGGACALRSGQFGKAKTFFFSYLRTRPLGVRAVICAKVLLNAALRRNP